MRFGQLLNPYQKDSSSLRYSWNEEIILCCEQIIACMPYTCKVQKHSSLTSIHFSILLQVLHLLNEFVYTVTDELQYQQRMLMNIYQKKEVLSSSNLHKIAIYPLTVFKPTHTYQPTTTDLTPMCHYKP